MMCVMLFCVDAVEYTTINWKKLKKKHLHTLWAQGLMLRTSKCIHMKLPLLPLVQPVKGAVSFHTLLLALLLAQFRVNRAQ